MTPKPTAPHKLPPCPHCKQLWHATSCPVIAPLPTGQGPEGNAQAAIPTWQERMPEPRRAYTCDMNCSSDRRHNSPTSCGDCMPVVVRGDSVAARDAEIADLRAALAAQCQGAQASIWVQYIDGVKTQNVARDEKEKAMVESIHRTMAPGTTMQWTALYESPFAAQQAAALGVTLEEVLYALDLVVNKMDVPGLSGQRAFAADVLERATEIHGSQGEKT